MSKFNLRLRDEEHQFSSRRFREYEDYEYEERRRRYEDDNYPDAEQPVDTESETNSPTTSPI
jgi:hypothetical protein